MISKDVSVGGQWPGSMIQAWVMTQIGHDPFSFLGHDRSPGHDPFLFSGHDPNRSWPNAVMTQKKKLGHDRIWVMTQIKMTGDPDHDPFL